MKTYKTQLAKLTIGSLDDSKLTVTAQYNPKELELARTVPWQKHNPDNTPDSRRPKSAPGSDVEYTGGEGRSISLELLFDSVEQNRSVLKEVLDLDEMATPRDATSTDSALRRPHQCVVVWGAYADLDGTQRPKVEKAMRPLRCVIDSLTVKYTMFSPAGLPLRAVANIKLREASVKLPVKPDDARARELAHRLYKDRRDTE